MLDSTLFGSLLFFLLFSISIYKLKPFFTTKQLPDDDRTIEAQEELISYVIEALKSSDVQKDPRYATIYTHVAHNPKFDENHFWRFNENRTQQLIVLLCDRHKCKNLEELLELNK